MIEQNDLNTVTWRDLPFAQVDDEGHTNFWAVRSSGDYASDCSMGRQFGSALIEYVEQNSDVNMLARVVAAMPPAEQRTGIEVGLLTAIGASLAGVHVGLN